jgi:tetratricopeptide (TPR) repeat protein
MRPGIAGDALAFYIYKLVMPVSTSVDYGRRPQAVLSHGWIYYTWLLPFAVFLVLWIKRKRWPIGLASGLLFILPLLPVLGFSPFMFQDVSTTADHYLYLAMLGPALLAAWMVDRYRGRIFMAVATIALAALVFETTMREPLWQNTRTLFQHVLDMNPASFIACDTLGFDHVREAHLHPGNSPIARGQLKIAAGYFVHAVELNPRDIPAYFNMAIAFQELGEKENSRRAVRRIADLQPSLPPELRTEPLRMAETLIVFGAYSDGVQWLDRILLNDPGNPAAIKLRAQALAAIRPDGG